MPFPTVGAHAKNLSFLACRKQQPPRVYLPVVPPDVECLLYRFLKLVFIDVSLASRFLFRLSRNYVHYWLKVVRHYRRSRPVKWCKREW